MKEILYSYFEIPTETSLQGFRTDFQDLLISLGLFLLLLR